MLDSVWLTKVTGAQKSNYDGFGGGSPSFKVLILALIESSGTVFLRIMAAWSIPCLPVLHSSFWASFACRTVNFTRSPNNKEGKSGSGLRAMNGTGKSVSMGWVSHFKGWKVLCQWELGFMEAV